MTAYNAIVTREGNWWMVRVPAIGSITQARRLSEAERMARELIAVTIDKPIGEVAVSTVVDSIGTVLNIQERLARINADRTRAADLERQATTDAAGLAKSLTTAGIPLRDIGVILGVSHQRAHQLATHPALRVHVPA